jgi:hypothetical protein
MREQIDAEKSAGLIIDPMQIAQQGQQELQADMADAKTGNAPTTTPVPNTSPESGDVADNKPMKGDLSLRESYSPTIRMLKRTA